MSADTAGIHNTACSRAKEKVKCVLQPAQWSRGMIPALGAGGPGFKSRLSPYIVLNLKYEKKNSLCTHISFLMLLIRSLKYWDYENGHGIDLLAVREWS